jgi:hypothetical protein
LQVHQGVRRSAQKGAPAKSRRAALLCRIVMRRRDNGRATPDRRGRADPFDPRRLRRWRSSAEDRTIAYRVPPQSGYAITDR